MSVLSLGLALALAADGGIAASAAARSARHSADGGTPATRSRFMKLDPSARDSELARLAALPLRERLLGVSKGFVGTPYLASPLGEGSGKDPDPLFRFDAVDCLSFVEQSIALSLSPPRQLEETLARIRYAAEPSYAGRNHLMEAEWLPNNIRKGFLRDVTRRFGGDEVQLAVKALTEKTWTSRTSAALELPPERRVTGRFEVPIIPLDRVLERASKAPPGTVLVVVREERTLLPTRVSHLGFLVKKKGPQLRHASRSFGRVLDEDLESFLLRNERYNRWKVVGAALYEVAEPAVK